MRSDKIQAVIDRFLVELTKAAREEVSNLILGESGETPKRSGGKRNGAAGGKRSAESLEALQGKVLSHIKAHPGERIEEINAHLGTDTKDLALPIRKLIASRAIRVEGKRRGTKYFASSIKTHAKRKAKR